MHNEIATILGELDILRANYFNVFGHFWERDNPCSIKSNFFVKYNSPDLHSAIICLIKLVDN